MTTHVESTGGNAVAVTPRLLNARWALRRALLGLFILVIGVGSVAWLTHASIDPSLETTQAIPAP
ncbi:MAG: hypothetical protein MUC37_09930 [Hyphomicrobium sp.]|jgi:hypothetical protein|nr:hypothetical protein [Hyphomicrobium sp.]